MDDEKFILKKIPEEDLRSEVVSGRIGKLSVIVEAVQDDPIVQFAPSAKGGLRPRKIVAKSSEKEFETVLKLRDLVQSVSKQKNISVLETAGAVVADLDAKEITEVARSPLCKEIRLNASHGLGVQAMATHEVNELTAIQMSDVRAGDVLLSFGDGSISDIIRIVDGGEYSHASYFDGSRIIEAGIRGVVESSLQTLVEKQRYVDLYRFKSDDGKWMGAEGLTHVPVSKAADQYLTQGTTYADNQFYLVGMLIIARKMSITKLDGAILRATLAMIFKVFKRILAGTKVKSVICSELVYRSFYEAGSDYGLSISGTISPFISFDDTLVRRDEVATTTHGEDVEETLGKLEDMYKQINPQYQPEEPCALILPRIAARNPLVAAELVSPRDLQQCPNLVRLGRLASPIID